MMPRPDLHKSCMRPKNLIRRYSGEVKVASLTIQCAIVIKVILLS